MANTRLRTGTVAFIGVLYGLVLSAAAFAQAGFGHGCYVLLGVIASPLTIASGVLVALLAPPVLWGGAACLAHRASSRGALLGFCSIMLAHYLALPVIVTGHGGDSYGDWYCLDRTRDAFVFGAIVYVVGQLALWSWFVARRRSISKPSSAPGR